MLGGGGQNNESLKKKERIVAGPVGDNKDAAESRKDDSRHDNIT